MSKKSRIAKLSKAITDVVTPDLKESEDEDEGVENTPLNTPKRKGAMKTVPKQAINFSDKEIRSFGVDEQIVGLLKAKREADAAGDKIASRKIRRALRAQAFYVSKVKEDQG